MIHTCHALDCTVAIPPKMAMCSKHWRMVPRELQSRIYALYRPRQEVDKNPSIAYLKAMGECQRQVKLKETGIDIGPYTLLDNVPERPQK